MYNLILEQNAPNTTDDRAVGINASGEAYGTAATGQGYYSVLLWSPTGTVTVFQKSCRWCR